MFLNYKVLLILIDNYKGLLLIDLLYMVDKSV